MRVDLGFAKRGLLNVVIDAPAIREDTAQQRAVGLRVIDRVRQMPGVQDAAMADWPLFHGILWTMSVRLPGHESDHREVHGLPVSPRYFETMKMRVLTAMLYEVQPLDTWTLALPVAGLLMTAVLAAVPPARRAARVDPVVALRHD